jgi:hypothetical protein
LSYAKQSHLFVSPVKLIFCGLSPLDKIGAIYTFFFAAQQPKSGIGRLLVKVSRYKKPVGLL